MERVAFLIEATGERIACMLNPETLVLKRSAGVQRRTSVSGHVTGAELTDDPLLYTGGGHTVIELDLLFDLDLDPQTPYTSVRRLTERIWQLAENSPPGGQYGSPPLVRFVWGKEWNLLGVVTAVAEHFERFTPTGEPRRSWLRLRFVRVNDRDQGPVSASSSAAQAAAGDGSEQGSPVRDLLPPLVPTEISSTTEIEATHTLLGEGSEGENLPELSYQYYGDPDLWWLIAWFNDVEHPLQMSSGSTMSIPSLSIMDQIRQWASRSSPSSPSQ
jgi:hypothetical protein